VNWKDLVDLAAITSAFIALAGFLVAARQFRKQMNVQLFLTFTERYGKIIDSFPPEARRARLEAAGEPPPESPEIHKCTLRYLNLCSEEYHLYRHGYIAPPIWIMWEIKMQRTLRSPLFRRAWQQQADEFDDHPEFVEYVWEVQGAGGKS
jgi:hypothetical protein